MTAAAVGFHRVVVIGAGILGASMAWRLSRKGVQVTLLDRSTPGSGASGHSFAWINASSKQPYHYHSLNRISLEMWPRFASELAEDGDGASVGLRWGGNLSWTSNPDAASRQIAEVRRLQTWGYPARSLSASELSDLEPALQAGTVTSAAYCEDEGQVEPQPVIDACLRRLEEGQAEMRRNTEVTGFALNGNGRIDTVETDSGDIPCDCVALAAGTDTTRLAAMAGVHVPQSRSPGVVVRTTPMPPLLRNATTVHAPPEAKYVSGVHFRQCADGSLMLGEGTQESLAEDDSQAHADDLLRRACRWLPDIQGASALPVPVGWRPMPADGYPAVGFASETPNLYIALSHSGVTLAPILSQLAALEICEGAPADAWLGPYRPQRFATAKAD